MRIRRILLLSGISISAWASPMEPRVSFRFDPENWKKDSTELKVRVELPPGWHIQSYAPLDSFLIPTTLRLGGAGLIFGKPKFPAAVEEEFPALGGKVALYQGAFEIKVPVRRTSKKVDKTALNTAQVVLRYQACNKTQCLPPKEVVVQLDTSASTRVKPLRDQIPARR